MTEPANTKPLTALEGAQTGTGAMLTVREVAAFLGMSTRWVHERVRRHEIPVYRFGVALRFDRDEIRRWRERYWTAPEGRVDPREHVRR